MPRPSWRNLPLLLYVAGTGLVIATVVLGILLLPDGGGHHAQTSLPVSTRPSQPPTPTTTPTTATLPTTEPTTTAPVAPPRIAMSWQTAGGLVYDAQAVDPTVLGNEMRVAGFGWVAVRIADGTTVIAPSPQWISLFRAASGLPVGGWSVLRDRPVQEAQLASSLIAQDGLDFYIANAEQEYAYTIGTDSSPDRFARSRAFVTAFRAAEPTLRAGLSSYCRPDGQDIDWGTWAKAGFAFLPQAYVGDLGPSGEPATCVNAAKRWFPSSAVHPTVGIFGGVFPTPSPAEYGRLLAAAGTVGFSLYPAETAQAEWQAYGQEIQALHIARAPS